MDITLTDAELIMLERSKEVDETPDLTLHRILTPFVTKCAEDRLQILADQYRALTPALQIEVSNLLDQWKASKGL